MQGLVLSALEVIGDRHGLSLAHLEGKGGGPGRAEFFDHPRSLDFAIGTGVGGQNADAADETLKAEALAIRESAPGRKRVGVVLADVLETKTKKRTLVKSQIRL